jgi:5-methylcytosine-specific restriction endonuclease McrA
MAQRDKQFLRELAKAAHMELRNRHLGKPFRISTKVRVYSTRSAGWAVTLGSFSGYQTSAEVWIDRFTGHPTRKVYYALMASKKDGLARLAKKAGREFGSHLSVYLKELNQDSNYFRLIKRLAKSRFGKPVYERYPEHKEFYYGIYEFDRTGLQRNEFTRLVERTADFFQTITESVSEDTAQSNYDVYHTVENRQSVTRHLRRERKSHAATLCKQRDNYVCQVCRFDFSKFYGPLGDDFAEAHHIIPLKSNKALRSTKIDDLITVCPNCHRMLHRMNGNRDDINNLGRIIRAHK